MRRWSLSVEGEESHWQNDSCELKDVWVESTGNARLPTWIPTFECTCKVFLEKWKWEGKFHTQCGWHHPKSSLDQMKEERKPSTTASFFLFPDHESSVTGPPVLITAMLFSCGGLCPFKLWAQKNPSSLKTTFAWNFVTETRNITNAKLKGQTQHPVIFSILWALIHWLWFLMGIIQDCVIGQLTMKKNTCGYILLISFLPETNVVF